MDAGQGLRGGPGQDHEDRQPRLYAVQAAEPQQGSPRSGDGVAGSGPGPPVPVLQALPFIVARGGHGAAVAAPGLPEAGLLPGGLHPGVDQRAAPRSLQPEAPAHGEPALSAAAVGGQHRGQVRGPDLSGQSQLCSGGPEALHEPGVLRPLPDGVPFHALGQDIIAAAHGRGLPSFFIIIPQPPGKRYGNLRPWAGAH